MTTYELIEKYAQSVLIGYNGLRIGEYTINGNIIKIEYNYLFNYGTDQVIWSNDNFLEIELLDYITFVYNLK